jgi:hypothetical protein
MTVREDLTQAQIERISLSDIFRRSDVLRRLRRLQPDGVSIACVSSGTIVMTPPLDSIRQFRVPSINGGYGLFHDTVAGRGQWVGPRVHFQNTPAVNLLNRASLAGFPAARMERIYVCAR